MVLIGHSLGGIACVDLLAGGTLTHVRLLVTVGSQAPLLYEMDALHGLRFGEPLPEHFPRWINLYDPHDSLSYKAAPLFQRRGWSTCGSTIASRCPRVPGDLLDQS